jgi:hypothetical protein
MPTFEQTEDDAIEVMKDALNDETWRDKCKARDVLKGLCGKYGMNYEHFRNLLISKLDAPPNGLSSIMNQILS